VSGRGGVGGGAVSITGGLYLSASALFTSCMSARGIASGDAGEIGRLQRLHFFNEHLR